ncbi:unnamed protein product [Orchesella dallaii]|uniref:Chitin-binding type-2 domain-containing protein n=1 Tax=Orchesella dallaii TaxID=48710 RepID=A0ABP1RLW0_9HEXA
MKSIFIIILYSLSIHTELSLSQDVECPTEGVSYLPLPDCTLYLICINGQGVETECPRPLYYNPQEERCDFPENVPECIGGTRPPSSGATPTTTEIPGETTTSSTTEIGESTVTVTQGPTEEPTIPPPINNTLTECGQTLFADSGLIEYKLNQNYEAGLLCTFIVRMEEFSECTFTLEYHGISDDRDAIAIIPLRGGQTFDLEFLGPAYSNRVTFRLSAFVVVFRTNINSTLGTGFRLRIEGGGNILTKIPGKLLVYNNEVSSPVEFPFEIDEPLQSQWDPVVLTSGAKLHEPGSSLELTVWEDFPSNDCGDFFDVHYFNGQITGYLER